MTFRNAEDAAAALQSELKRQSAVIVNIIPVPIPSRLEIAEQPMNPINENPPNHTTLLDLNDDCLLSILEHCDLDARSSLWQVCHRTRYLLDKFVLSKEDTDYKILYGSQPDELLRVPKRVRENMIYLGSRVKKLRLELDLSFVQQYEYPYPPEIHKTVEHCSKFVGASLNEIEFIRMPNYLDCFRQNQTLNNVEKLTIHTFAGWSGQIKSQLPNLKQLKISAEDIGGRERLMGAIMTRYTGSEIDFLKTRLNLEKLAIRRIVTDQMLITLLQNNSQLKCLELMAENYQRANFNDLQHLEELIIYGDVPLSNLKNLKILKKLGIQLASRRMDTDLWLQTITSRVLQLKTLRSIMLSTSIGDRSERFYENIRIIGHVPHLEHFYMKHDDFSESAIIDFVNAAKYLRTLWLVGCSESHITHSFMKTLADIRKGHFGVGPDGIILLELIFSDSTPSLEKTRKTVRISTLNTVDRAVITIFDFFPQINFGAEIGRYVKVEKRPLSQEDVSYFPEFPS